MTGSTYNIAAEEVLLGTILLSPETAGHLAESLGIDDFAGQKNRLLFEAIQITLRDGKTPSPVLLAPLLPDLKKHMAHLLTLGVTLCDALGYASHLRTFTARRRMLAIADEMRAVARNVAADPAQFNIAAIQALDELCTRARTIRPSLFDAGTISAEIVAELKSGRKPDVIRTGLTDLDRVLGGLPRKELLIEAGRPGMGKSAVLFSAARQGAKQGAAWLIFSLEMPRDAAMARMLSDAVYNAHTPVPYDRILKREVQSYEIERLEGAAAEMHRLSIHIDDQTNLTAAEIAIRARRHADRLAKQGKRLDVVAVDHLGKVCASERYAGQKTHETGEKTNALMCLARELNVCAFVAQQLNRGNEKRENRRAEISDLRDCGNIEEDAHTILLPFRLAYYLERIRENDESLETKRREKLKECRNIIEINIAKNRNGPCKNLRFMCEMGSNVIRDLAV